MTPEESYIILLQVRISIPLKESRVKHEVEVQAAIVRDHMFLVVAARNEWIKITEIRPLCMSVLPRGELSSLLSLSSLFSRFHLRSYDYFGMNFAHINFALGNLRQNQNVQTTCTVVGGLEIFWTSSASECDYDDSLLRFLEAEIGHLHFHTNRKSSRIQVWILESKSWEEHAVNRGERMELIIEEMVRESYWLGLVCNARRIINRRRIFH